MHSGFWVGVLGTEGAQDATDLFYARSVKFGDEEFALSGLRPWEASAIERHTRRGTSILIPAAGSGREVIALARLGYTTAGYDPNPTLVEIGQRIIAASHLEAALVRSADGLVPDGVEGMFDAVLFGWGGISHVPGRKARVRVFMDLAARLEPGGVIIVSFLYRPDDSRTYAAIQRIATVIRKLMRSPDLPELGDTADGSFDHHFTFDEMATELQQAGFDEVERVGEPFAHMAAIKR